MTQQRIARFCPLCGAPLGLHEREGITRPVCPACGHIVYFDPKVAVAILIMQGDRILLIKRGNDPLKGYWAMPAGFMEWDEDPKTAGAREVAEETGLKVRIDRLLDVFHTPADGGIANIVIVYAATITGGQLCASDDAEAAAWFTRATVPDNIAFLPSQTIVRLWQAGEL
jgi:8-oxo-dGTP diphosphatase